MAPWIPINPHPLDGQVFCNCNLPAKLHTTRKEGRNLDRQFFFCNKGFGDPQKCSYFKWADELMSQQASPDQNSSQSTLATSPSSSPTNPTANQPESALTAASAVPSTPTLNRAIRGPSGGDLPTPPPTTPRRRAPLTPFEEARRRHLIHHALITDDEEYDRLPVASPRGAGTVPPANPPSSTPTASETEVDLARSHPWPAVLSPLGRNPRAGQSRPHADSSSASEDSGSSHKRRRVEIDDKEDELNPFIARPSQSLSGGGLFGHTGTLSNRSITPSRIEMNGRRVDELERRIEELEETRQTQANLIQSQAELIARSEQALQAVENTNRTLQARIERIEQHAAQTEALVATHDRSLFGDATIDESEL